MDVKNLGSIGKYRMHNTNRYEFLGLIIKAIVEINEKVIMLESKMKEQEAELQELRTELEIRPGGR